MKQALRDLEHAEDSRKAGRHEWACFAAHQAAEKGVKALHLRLGQEERRSARWDTTELPVPADLVVYTREEWERLTQEGGRFAATLRRETVWVSGGDPGGGEAQPLDQVHHAEGLEDQKRPLPQR